MNDLAPLTSQSNPNNTNIPVNNGQQPDVQESLSNTERLPLRQHVQLAVKQYFVELEGEMPTNLYDTMLQEFERPLIEVVLEQTKGNQSKSAKILGLNRGTLRKKMSQYGLM